MGWRPHPIVVLRDQSKRGPDQMTKTLKIFIALVAVLALVPTSAALAAPKGKVRFSATSYSVREGDPAGDAVAHVTVTHKGPAVNVNYTTTSGTATPGSDYTPV